MAVKGPLSFFLETLFHLVCVRVCVCACVRVCLPAYSSYNLPDFDAVFCIWYQLIKRKLLARPLFQDGAHYGHYFQNGRLLKFFFSDFDEIFCTQHWLDLNFLDM